MSQTPTLHQAFLKLLEQSVEKCAQRLGRLSYSTWSIDTVSLSAGDSAALEDLLGPAAEVHFGTYLGIPGGGFLVVFPPKSGYLVTNRFTISGADPVDALPERESAVLSEVSNIIINAMVDVLAESCGKTMLLTGPTALKGPKRDILKDARAKFPAAGTPAWTCYVRLKTPTFASDCDLLAFLDQDLFDLLSKPEAPKA